MTENITITAQVNKKNELFNGLSFKFDDNKQQIVTTTTNGSLHRQF